MTRPCGRAVSDDSSFTGGPAREFLQQWHTYMTTATGGFLFPPSKQKAFRQIFLKLTSLFLNTKINHNQINKETLKLFETFNLELRYFYAKLMVYLFFSCRYNKPVTKIVYARIEMFLCTQTFSCKQ